MGHVSMLLGSVQAMDARVRAVSTSTSRRGGACEQVLAEPGWPRAFHLDDAPWALGWLLALVNNGHLRLDRVQLQLVGNLVTKLFRLLLHFLVAVTADGVGKVEVAAHVAALDVVLRLDLEEGVTDAAHHATLQADTPRWHGPDNALVLLILTTAAVMARKPHGEENGRMWLVHASKACDNAGHSVS